MARPRPLTNASTARDKFCNSAEASAEPPLSLRVFLPFHRNSAKARVTSLNPITLALVIIQLPDADVSPEDRKVARRYLAVVNRRRILAKAKRRAERRARRETVLGQLPFTAPLSVAGGSSALVVR